MDILHTVGGDDTNTTAADLAAYLEKNNYSLKVIGLPKTSDNDIIPIRQSLGAVTAAEQGEPCPSFIAGPAGVKMCPTVPDSSSSTN